MSAKTNYLENKILDHIFRGIEFTMPAGIYVGLFTAAPGEAGGGTEVTGGSYARVAVGPSAAAWKSTQDTASGASSGTIGLTRNASTVSFPVPSAPWGDVTHFGIFDALTAGNLLYVGTLDAPRTITTGVVTTFPPDSLTVSEQ
jgi:hypothetical protein